MTRPTTRQSWSPRLARHAGPAYRAIADALEADIRAGQLSPGDPLPTQRDLAKRLGVNFTTVTRAYAEAQRRGLVTATVGRGTFVASAGSGLNDVDIGDHDLSVNAPPLPAWVATTLRATLARLSNDSGVVASTLSYESRLGSLRARDAGVRWLQSRGLDAEPERVVLTAGAQHALATLLATIVRPGDAILTEALAYPGLQSAAELAGVRVVGVDLDDEGLRPDLVDKACRRVRPKAIFCVPTAHNPTTATMSLERRRAIVSVARRHRVPIVEDDICGPLFPDVRPLASLAPELVTYIGSLSKSVAPALRVAFVLSPTAEASARVAAAVRASVLMLAPLPVAVASAWIEDGTAERVIADVRKEATERGSLTSRILGDDNVICPAGSIHAWLRLPSSWTLAAYVAQAQQQGVRVAPADWYVAPGDERVTPNAVRLTLGAEASRPRLEEALRTLAALLRQPMGRSPSNL